MNIYSNFSAVKVLEEFKNNYNLFFYSCFIIWYKSSYCFQRVGRMYGFKPKYMRMQVLHKYMFYLIYGFEGDERLDQQQALSEVASQTTLSDDVRAEMSQIYTPSLDWQMFLPPLPIHSTQSFTNIYSVFLFNQ